MALCLKEGWLCTQKRDGSVFKRSVALCAKEGGSVFKKGMALCLKESGSAFKRDLVTCSKEGWLCDQKMGESVGWL